MNNQLHAKLEKSAMSNERLSSGSDGQAVKLQNVPKNDEMIEELNKMQREVGGSNAAIQNVSDRTNASFEET